jgi:nucleotide-binding universal stress UspA family protein
VTKHHSFRTILCPIDFDEKLDAGIAVGWRSRADRRRNHSRLHAATPITGGVVQIRLDMSVTEASDANENLREICRDRLSGIGYEVLTRTGDPAIAVVGAAEELKPDLIVIATQAATAVRRHSWAGSPARDTRIAFLSLDGKARRER